MKLSVVTLTWNREPTRLRDLLWTLTNQTHPPDEIVIVDGNTDLQKQAETIAVTLSFMPDERTRIKIVLAEMEEFSLARGINIGIKKADVSLQYVMVTGVDMLFGPNVIETVITKLTPHHFCVAQCGFLVEDVFPPPVVHAGWDSLCKLIKPNPPVKISTGAMMTASWAWWFKYRGYDEIAHPFAYADSDLTLRMEMSGLQQSVVLWDEAQLIHVWHETSPLVAELGGTWPDPKKPLIRNPGGWGEFDALTITGEIE